VVLTKERVVRQSGAEYHIPAGTVIDIRTLPVVTTYNAGPDTKLMPAGTLKIGDVVPS
jgi:hypothetical protein